MKILRISLCCGIFFLSSSILFSLSGVYAEPLSRDDFQPIISWVRAVSFIEHPPHYVLYDHIPTDGYEEPQAIAFCTLDCAPEVRGYGGSIDLLVIVSLEGVIQHIEILSHHETLSYIERIKQAGFLKHCIGWKNSAQSSLSESLDAISGATVSSKAILATIQQGLEVMQPVFEKYRPSLQKSLADEIVHRQQERKGILPNDEVVLPTYLQKAGIMPYPSQYYRSLTNDKMTTER